MGFRLQQKLIPLNDLERQFNDLRSGVAAPSVRLVTPLTSCERRVLSNKLCLLIYCELCCCRLMKVMIRQSTVQWVSGRQMARHRLLPVTASNAVFPACTSSLSLINYGPQLQQPTSHWAVPVTSFSTDNDVIKLVALGNREAARKLDDGELSLASITDSQVCSFRCCLFLQHV